MRQQLHGFPQNHRAAWPPLYRRIDMNAHCGLWCILLDLNQRSDDYKSAAQTIWAEDASCHTLVVTNGIFLVIWEAFKKSAKPNWLLAAQTGIEPVRHGVKVRCLTSWLLRYIPTGSFWVMPSTILERRATTWTLAASCNGLVWMVRLELTASASQMRRSANWTTSRFGGWVIYPLTSHSSCIIITRNIRTGILTSCIVP